MRRWRGFAATASYDRPISTGTIRRYRQAKAHQRWSNDRLTHTYMRACLATQIHCPIRKKYPCKLRARSHAVHTGWFRRRNMDSHESLTETERLLLIAAAV